MRVSTAMIFQRGLDAMQQRQSSLLDTQQRIAANTRLLRPSDDPVAASRAVEASQAKAINTQYGANQAAARDALALAESTLGNIGDALQDARTLLVAANSGSLTNDDRMSLAIDLQGKLDQLLGLANSRDGAGAYLFAGYQDAQQPFMPNADGSADYYGDQGKRELQVGPGRTLAVNAHGAEVFESIRAGNGVFVTSADDGNQGTGVISVGRPVGAIGNVANYRIEFAVDAVSGATTYEVFDVDQALSVHTGNYVSGGPIEFNGLRFEISGTPADGDEFTIEPAPNMSMFNMLAEAVSMLKTPIADDVQRARFNENIERGLANMDRAIDRVLVVRTEMGASLRELDALNNLVQDNQLHYEQRLSELQDLDYAAALSQFAQEQMALEAARMSYQRISSLSLFNYL